MPLNVLLQTHSCVSHRLTNASLPPTAKYLPVGLNASDKHAEVWACREWRVCKNAEGGLEEEEEEGSVEILEEQFRGAGEGGHAAIFTLPSPVVRRITVGGEVAGA